MVTFSEIHDAFLFANLAEEGMNRAILCKDTCLMQRSIWPRSEMRRTRSMTAANQYCSGSLAR
jgi:hypothetical protein